jgi:uncharacterized membrane protein YbhN (UPF0104 family)
MVFHSDMTPDPDLPAQPAPQDPTPSSSGPADPVSTREVSGPPPLGSQLFAKRAPALVALMRSRVSRLAFLVVVLGLLVVALVDQAGTLWTEVQRLSAPVVLLALVANLAALICSMMVWRSLLADLGSKLSLPEAWRIMFIGQLAKYVPGSIWPVVAQTELGADRGIPRGRSAVSVLLGYAVMTCTGGVVAAVTLPFTAAGSFDRYFWVLFAVPVVLVVLSPPVLNRLFGLLLRLLRRSPLQRGLSVQGLSRTMVWALASWFCNGLMTYVLMRELAGDSRGTLLVSVGGYALAWVAGFVAVFAPAGAGVREAVMVAVLSTRTTGAIALTVALVTRALGVVSDGMTGAVAAALIGRRKLQRLRAAGSPSEVPAADG